MFKIKYANFLDLLDRVLLIKLLPKWKVTIKIWAAKISNQQKVFEPCNKSQTSNCLVRHSVRATRPGCPAGGALLWFSCHQLWQCAASGLVTALC